VVSWGKLDDLGSNTGYDYRFDPTRPESRIARLAVDDALQRADGRVDPTKARDQIFSEPGARYIDFLIPGLIGLNLMGSGMWGLGFAIVQARTQRLLKRLAATPMRRWHFLLSFMLSRLIFLVLEVAAILVFAYFVFDVKVHGSWLNLALAALIGSMAFSGIGLLVGARTKTIEGASGLMNLVMLPMWLLSGSFFSASKFPDFVQPFIKALPLTVLNEALRAVMNDGAGLEAIGLSLGILSLWGIVSFIIALRIFRWQ
jgi:ABC-2 type transport system permease protein